MDYTCKNIIIQNMKDFGSDDKTIDEFLSCFDKNDYIGQKRILNRYRKKLLSELHQKQREVELFDFMVYQLEKCKCK